MELSAQFDESIYSLSAIKKAAYRYIDKYSVVISKEGSHWNCLFSFPENCSENQALRNIDEFKKELLDQDLRESIKAETENIRNLILAHAFSKTGLIRNE